MNKEQSIRDAMTIIVGFVLVYLTTGMKWALHLAAAIGIAGLISNYLLTLISVCWRRLAILLSMIVPMVLLVVIYYAVLTPLSFLSKVFGPKNQLFLKKPDNSVFVDTEKDFSKKSFEKLW